MSIPKWLEWAQNLQALAQAGLAYNPNPFDIERYQHIRQIAAEIISTHTLVDLPIIQRVYEQQAGYTTPKVDVRGAVFKDGKILLVKELMDHGLWTMPGGWVDVNESPSRAAEREVWEESGYEVKTVRLLAIYDRNLHGFPPFIFHTYKMFFLCELTGGKPTTSIETGGADFFAQQDLPALSVARTTTEIIHRMFELQCHPDWPADFD